MPLLLTIKSSRVFRRCRRTLPLSGAAFVWCLLMAVRPCAAQDIEPRRWSHLPMGSQTVTAGYATTEGEIFLNPVLRIEDAEFELNTTAVKYIRSFAFLGKSARVDVLGSWQSGEWSGLLDGMPASTEREGWSDATVRFAINLLGAPPLEIREFAAYRAKTKIETIAGAALAVPPCGTSRARTAWRGGTTG